MMVVNAGCVDMLAIPGNRRVARVAAAEFRRTLSLYHMQRQYNDGVATSLIDRVAIRTVLTELLAAE